MDVSQMLHEMCHSALSAADIKAIGKSRGFSAKEIATPTLLANFFLSPIGIEAALLSLSGEEITFLHFLNKLDREVDIKPFARIYGDESVGRKYYSGTFTQKYGNTFRQVNQSLVRKGVLLIAEQVNGGDTKMERWRFRFPSEFEHYLPPLLPEITILDVPGVFREDVLRTKLLKIIKGSHAKLTLDPPQYAWEFKDGVLFMGEKPYSLQRLEAWQMSCWQTATSGKKQVLSYVDNDSDKIEAYTPIQAAVQALSQLGPHAWVLSQQLAPVLKVFSRQDMDCEKMCRSGWDWGMLTRLEMEGQMLYRLAPAVAALDAELEPVSYLNSPNGHFLEIDLQTVPFKALAQLNQIANFEIVNDHLVARPDFIFAGRASESVRSSPLAQWLRNNVLGFRQIFERLDKRWGKHILHDNLMLARVKDLSLKVKIEKSLGPQDVISLADDFIAFPVGLAPKVRRIVSQADFAVKEVGA